MGAYTTGKISLEVGINDPNEKPKSYRTTVSGDILRVIKGLIGCLPLLMKNDEFKDEIMEMQKRAIIEKAEKVL